MEKRYRHRLARSIDALQAEAAAPMLRRPSELPLYRRRVVAAVAPELAAIADALRGEEADVRGVALCVRLLSGGDSPLYGDDTERLAKDAPPGAQDSLRRIAESARDGQQKLRRLAGGGV